MAQPISLLANPLVWKAMVTLLGICFGLANLLVDARSLVTLPDGEIEFHDAGIKAACFAMITAVALFAGSLPTGNGRWDRIVDSSSRILGILSTLGAGWFWLYGETHGSPGGYLYGLVILTTTAFVTVLIWGGIYAMLAVTLKQVGWALRHPIASVARLAGALVGWQHKRSEIPVGRSTEQLAQSMINQARHERDSTNTT